MRTKNPETMERIVRFVDDFFDQHLRTPSMREIEAGTGLSRQTASSYLREMASSGTLEYDGRGGIVTEHIRARAAAQLVTLPIIGRAGIYDGDLVVIRKTPTATVGQIVVAVDDEGQTTLKRLKHDGERYYLHPENPAFADIYPEELRVQGVAELMLRDLKH